MASVAPSSASEAAVGKRPGPLATVGTSSASVKRSVSSSPTSSQPPIANRWIRLAVCSFASMLSCGMIPGASVWVEIFSKHGVFRSACIGTNTTAVHNATAVLDTGDFCSNQSLMLSGAFQAGSLLAFVMLLPAGMVFDHRGGRVCGVTGAAISVLGLLLLEIPLWGAQSSARDATTAPTLPWILLLTETGAILNSMSLYGLLWHFPREQTMLIAIGTATYQVSALLPNAVQSAMRSTGWSVESCLLIYSGVAAVSGVGCWFCAASLAEYRREAKAALGLPLPKPPSGAAVWRRIKNAARILRVHAADHIWMLSCTTLAVNVPFMYTNMAGSLARELWGGGGDELTRFVNDSTAVVGGLCLPFFCLAADKAGAMAFMNYSLALMNWVLAFTVGLRSWNAQRAASVCCVLWNGIVQVFFGKYLLAYTMPTQIGTVQGLLLLGMTVMITPVTIGSYDYVSDHGMVASFQLFQFIGAGVFSLFTLRFLIVGLPSQPVLLKEDEEELAEPFGCKTLEEVVYVTNLGSRAELLKILSSNKVEDYMALTQRVDYARMAEQMDTAAAQEGVPTSTATTRQVCPLRDSDSAESPAAKPPDEPTPVACAARDTVVNEVEIIAVTCESAYGRNRCAVSYAPWFFSGWCCSSSLTQPLLQHEVVPTDPAEETRSKTVAARELNERLVALVREGNKEAVLDVYRDEDPELLWVAYQELFEQLSKEEMVQFENSWEDLIPEEELKEVINARPAMRIITMKMIALRTKKNVFG